MDPDKIKRICGNLSACIDGKTVAQAKQVVRGLSGEEMLAVGRQTDDNGETLLCRAIGQGRPSFVKFLLEDCFADPNQHCKTGEDMMLIPLCHAADFLYIQIARLLVEYGAEVNAAADDQCTAVHSACYGALTLVQYLVEHGADINIPDIYGETCLMRALSYTVFANSSSHKVSRYLVEHGASVNVVDNLGNSPLHHALGSMRNVRLLVSHGADASIRNKFDDDAPQAAALRGRTEVVDYLISELQPTQQRCADLYSIVASQKLIELGDSAAATQFWKKSLTFLMQTSQDEGVAGPNPVYNGAVEARNVESLEAIADDSDALYMQALICRERILGRDHKETVRAFLQRADHYADSPFTFQRGLELFRHGLESCAVTPLHSLWDLYAPLSRFFHTLLCRYLEGAGDVPFDEVAAMMEVMIRMNRCPFTVSRSIHSFMPFIVERSVDVLGLLWCVKSSEAESLTLTQLARDLVQARRNSLNFLLLRAINPYSPLFDDMSPGLVEELLSDGANPNAGDFLGNTPLHILILGVSNPSASLQSIWSRMIETLLHYGAEWDIPNTAGETVADLFPPNIDKMKYVTLRRLAARAIRKHGVPYGNLLPKFLCDAEHLD